MTAVPALSSMKPAASHSTPLPDGTSIILACDTTQGACSVALVRAAHGEAHQVLASDIQPMTRGHAEALMPMVQQVMIGSGYPMSDISGLAVTLGPGTFTGVRLGLAAMRAFSVSLDIPLVGISTMAAMAQPALGEHCVFVAIDAKRGEYYGQGFSPIGEALMDPAAIPVQSIFTVIAETIPEGPIFLVGTAAARIIEDSQRDPLGATLTPRLHSAEVAHWPTAEIVAAMSATLFGSGFGTSDMSSKVSDDLSGGLPEPIYLRPPDATLPDISKRPTHLNSLAARD